MYTTCTQRYKEEARLVCRRTVHIVWLIELTDSGYSPSPLASHAFLQPRIGGRQWWEAQLFLHEVALDFIYVLRSLS